MLKRVISNGEKVSTVFLSDPIALEIRHSLPKIQIHPTRKSGQWIPEDHFHFDIPQYGIRFFWRQ